MIYYELVGATKEDVISQKETLCKRYHPAGYGTSFSRVNGVLGPVVGGDGLWRARVSRSQSCD